METLERIAILRDFRISTYDVLVGINLLREGLDIPENLDYFEIPGKTSKLDKVADEDIDKTIARLQKEMKDAAKNLEFEKAAEIRDRLRELKELRIFV